MTQPKQPLNLDFLNNIKLDDDSPDLEIVRGSSDGKFSVSAIDGTDAECDNKFAEFTDAQLSEKLEDYEKHLSSYSGKFKDGGEKIIKTIEKIKAEKRRREMLFKKDSCQNGASAGQQLRHVSDANARNSSRLGSDGASSGCKIHSLQKKRERIADFESCVREKKREVAQILSKGHEITPSNQGFDCQTSSKKLAVSRLHSKVAVEQISFNQKQKFCFVCDKILTGALLASTYGTEPLCAQCKSQTRSTSTTLFRVTQESLEEQLLNCSAGEGSVGKGSAGKRGHMAAIGESPDTAMELSDDECQQLIDPAVNTQTCGSHHAKRQGLRSTFRRKEGLKTAYPSRFDPEAVEVQYSDLRHLAPFEFLNDTVIDFYIKFIQRSEFLKSERKKLFHFFNSFFYKKLLLGKKKTKGNDPFLKLRKWTKGINIFDKSYLLIPVHDSAHWSLAIICFPRLGAVHAHILHLDSMSSGHVSQDVFRVLKSYLEAEWKHISQDSIDIRSRRILPAEYITERVQVPLQENESDCGLFLLYYIERFVQDAPLQFEPNDLKKMFGRHWFKPEDASHLRITIKNILERLFEAEERGGPNCGKAVQIPLEVCMEDVD